MLDYLFLLSIPLILIIGYFVIRSLHQRVWKPLQDKYLFAFDFFNGENLRIRQMSINGIDNRNTLLAKASGQGFFLKLTFPFNVFSRPILIPWEEFVDVQDYKTILMRYKRILIGNPFVTTIELSEKDYNKIKKYLIK